MAACALGRIHQVLAIIYGPHADAQQDDAAVDTLVELGGDEARLFHRDALYRRGDLCDELVSPGRIDRPDVEKDRRFRAPARVAHDRAKIPIRRALRVAQPPAPRDYSGGT
jgi:hypothetical protein